MKLTPEVVEQLGFRPDADGWLVLKVVAALYLKPIPDMPNKWCFRTHVSEYSKEYDCYIPEHEVEEVDEIMGFAFSDAFGKAILGED